MNYVERFIAVQLATTILVSLAMWLWSVRRGA